MRLMLPSAASAAASSNTGGESSGNGTVEMMNVCWVVGDGGAARVEVSFSFAGEALGEVTAEAAELCWERSDMILKLVFAFYESIMKILKIKMLLCTSCSCNTHDGKTRFCIGCIILIKDSTILRKSEKR